MWTICFGMYVKSLFPTGIRTILSFCHITGIPIKTTCWFQNEFHDLEMNQEVTRGMNLRLKSEQQQVKGFKLYDNWILTLSEEWLLVMDFKNMFDFGQINWKGAVFRPAVKITV